MTGKSQDSWIEPEHKTFVECTPGHENPLFKFKHLQLPWPFFQSVTLSVMIYYTPAFEAVENDIEGYVATMMSELNQGYTNTGVDLEAELHCISPINVDDNGASYNVLTRFRAAFSKN